MGRGGSHIPPGDYWYLLLISWHHQFLDMDLQVVDIWIACGYLVPRFTHASAAKLLIWP